ncbi:hypothetical protein [Thomasclavelia ramosa]|uniref:hypothetical protein n=1 Tax=Thomasclavelia ramosa TaxID=1547 RepID=UPI0034A88BA7
MLEKKEVLNLLDGMRGVHSPDEYTRGWDDAVKECMLKIINMEEKTATPQKKLTTPPTAQFKDSNEFVKIRNKKTDNMQTKNRHTDMDFVRMFCDFEKSKSCNSFVKVVPIPNYLEMEFLGQIIDSFEDFLEEKKVSIKNHERTEDNHSDNPAIIFGSDYDNIEDSIRRLLQNWNILLR